MTDTGVTSLAGSPLLQPDLAPRVLPSFEEPAGQGGGGSEFLISENVAVGASVADPCAEQSRGSPNAVP